jgi:hypothetical protein
MSKDKKRKFQAVINQKEPSVLPNNPQPQEVADHHLILKHDLIKVFILMFGIIAIYIGLFFYDNSTGKVTGFAEKISNYIIK